MFVESPMTNDEEASAFLEPMVQVFLQSNMRGMDPRVVAVHHVVRNATANQDDGEGGGGGVTFVTTPPLPTPAPISSRPTLSPTPIPPVRPGEPTRTPTTTGPTSSPVSRSPSETAEPTVAPSAAPVGSTVTLAPVTPAPSPNAVVVEPRSERGVDRIDWWGWLLIVVGGIGLLLCLYTLFRGSGGGAGTGTGRVAPKNDRPDDDDDYVPPGSSYIPPGRDEYQPPGIGPGLGTFAEADDGPLSTFPEEGGEYEDGDEDGEYEEGDGEYEDEEEEEESEGSYDDDDDVDEGEEDDEVGELGGYEEGDGDSYDEETTYEEVTVYEEEGGGAAPQASGQNWSSEYSVGRSPGGRGGGASY